jgi:uncharacterized membrane protein
MIEIIPNWHPILVHFTIALLAIATLLFVVSAVAGRGRAMPGSKWPPTGTCGWAPR